MIQHVDGPRVSSAVSAGISTNSRLYEQFASLEENQRFNMSVGELEMFWYIEDE